MRTPLITAAAALVGGLALTAPTAHASTQATELANGTYRYSVSRTNVCAVPDTWHTSGGVSMSIAYDLVLVVNRTGKHRYIQPHPGSGWAVIRTTSDNPWKIYIQWLEYRRGAGGSGEFAASDPHGAANVIAAYGSARALNNAQGVPNIHNGTLGTNKWWRNLDLLDPNHAISMFRGTVSLAAVPYIAMYYNKVNANDFNTGYCDRELSWDYNIAP
jgi:hypothetical protein